MLPKGNPTTPSGQVRGKLKLRPKRTPTPDRLGLPLLGIPNPLGQQDNLVSAGPRNKQDPIGITKNHIITRNRPHPDGSGRQRILRPVGEAERTGRNRPQTEHRQPDRLNIGSIPVQPPDHDPGKPGSLSLQHHQISDAALIKPPTVVNNQHVTRSGRLERLQEDVHAADMPSRTNPPGNAPLRDNSPSASGRTPHRYPCPNAPVSQVRGGQSGEPDRQLVSVHASLAAFIPAASCLTYRALRRPVRKFTSPASGPD